MAIPDGIGINHYGWAVFALIQTSGFVDADFGAKSGGFGELLQLGEELALSVGGAGWAGSIGGSGVVTDKNVAFKCGQAVFLLGAVIWMRMVGARRRYC